ncbi:MAG TPA: c-type cytochrome [bacterium]|nr:c-type cytochrome [bacterium]HQJ64057.1 c-type cytochrome [bacterium]
MNYPIWELTWFGGSSLIALIAVLHAYISHLAVGGGLFIWLMDWKGFRENNPEIHVFVRKYTWFFLLLTMVFGGITGVGIWFIIALVHPAATSSLIHTFVFGWAIEWVFFVGEITALLVYHYQFSKLEKKPRLVVAFLYALFAWLSLVVINGILTFMLTPGEWLQTGRFLNGFLNPTFLPATLFRTGIAVMIAGLFGIFGAVRIPGGYSRNEILRTCSRWILTALPFMAVTGWWYYHRLPAAVRLTAFSLNPQSTPFITIGLAAAAAILLLAFFFLFRAPRGLQRIFSVLLVLLGLGVYGGFEYLREIARKPYIIYDYMYSTSILGADLNRLNDEGVLAHAKWSTVHEVTADNQLEAGKTLFEIQCLPCHTVGGVRNDILTRTATFPLDGIRASLHGQGKVKSYMPPVAGTPAEREALALYIIQGLQKKPAEAAESHPPTVKAQETIPPFDSRKAEYVLLAWNDLGMHCMTDCDAWFVVLPPANTLHAQLIRRGDPPILVREGVTLHYQVEKGHEDPAAQIPFWDYARFTFTTELEHNIGLGGKGLIGTMDWKPDFSSFVAEMLPVAPYDVKGNFAPFPTFTVEAQEAGSGKLIASTRVVAPVSSEMGCRSCHGGGWKRGVAGVSDETAINILTAHDRDSGTTLLAEARAGRPALCQSCHADPAVGAKGDGRSLNFSAAMHGWHANYVHLEGAAACASCHPAKPDGATRCARDFHKELGVTCAECHGTLEEHAMGLLRGEEAKAPAAQLIRNLKSDRVAGPAEVHPRTPWLQEPDCLNCHSGFQPPQDLASFNQWTPGFSALYRVRTDNAGLRCEACHSATHALYPADNPFTLYRDNIQPRQYMGLSYAIGANKNCAVCHKKAMTDPIHHENMLGMARNPFDF